MKGIFMKTNYDIAKEEADKIDKKILDVLCAGKSFRVEAGAGSGKTYSLNKIIEWIQDNKWYEYSIKGKKVACLTYTNAAVNVIISRLKDQSFIVPSTIHTFAWNNISQFQSTLMNLIEKNDLLPDDILIEDILKVSYTLGHKYVEKGTLYLYHNDVITLFTLMLDNSKFRGILTQKYPVILIDEYQDSYKPLIDKFLEYFISQNCGPQFGFFGDAWQTIYQSNKACGLIVDENLEVIKKVANFRSSPKIVDLLNKLRPDLPQVSAIDNYEGIVMVVTSNDYLGTRRIDRNFKGELLKEVLEERINKIEEHCKKSTPDGEKIKILMITHKVLASQQGYESLLELFGDGFKNADDPIFTFVMNTIEPLIKALSSNNMTLLFETLGVTRYPIQNKAQKKEWHKLNEKLSKAKLRTLKDVLQILISSKLVPIPPKVLEFYNDISINPNKEYQNGTVQQIAEIPYVEFSKGVDYLKPDSVFSTDHGVKGEEYDNVIFVVSKGWNNYQFDKYMPQKVDDIQEADRASYERNRNLFYVCCSRPQKRLIIFVSIPVDGEFKVYLEKLVGKDNIITYTDFITNSTL